MKRLNIIVIILFVLFASSTHAQTRGYYLSGSAGATLLSDAKLEANNLEFGEFSFDPGFNVGGALGYNFGAVRVEAEIAYHRNEMDEIFENSLVSGCPCMGPID